MKDIKKKLSKEQINKGIIFTSTLSKYRNEQEEDTVHSVYDNQEDKNEIIARLSDTTFFINSPYNFNIIRTI